VERVVLWHRWVVPAREVEGEAAAIAAFTRSVAARLEAAGASMILDLSGSVAATFDLSDLGDAVELALELLEEADRAGPEGEPLAVAFALAAGELSESDAGRPRGAAIDRAQQMANRARGGELVLDASARELGAWEFLFGRNVGGGPGGPRGQALDRHHPRRDACRDALSRLGSPPLAPCALDPLGALREVAVTEEPARVVLRGPFGSGAATVLDAVAGALAPSLVLRIGAAPGGLEPLGSLRLALGRHPGGAASILGRLVAAGATDAAETLGEIASGRGVPRADALDALIALLELPREQTGRPWVVLEQTAATDPTSIELVCEAQIGARTPALVVARLTVDAVVPTPLARPLTPHEITIPPLHTADALVIASAVLGGEATDADLVRRVAVLGGELPLGVVEAARLLVADGELVPDGDGFAWRAGARHVTGGASIEAIVLERLRGIEPIAQQLLEIACVLPDGATDQLAESVITRDGLGAADRARAREVLVAAHLAKRGPSLAPANKVLRAAVLGALPSARSVDLHRHVADALAEGGITRQLGLGAATLGYYLGEGGLASEAAEALLSAARAASAFGYGRAALRLAAIAVRFDPSETTRNAAAAMTHAVSSRPPAPDDGPPVVAIPRPPRTGVGTDVPGPAAADRVRLAADALRKHEFTRAEALLDDDDAVTGAVASRLRAVARLARGDAAAALADLARARASGDAGPRETARTTLALGVAMLDSGDPGGALRVALGALAASRASADALGERAALVTLSACYSALGRVEDAAALEALAMAGRSD